MPDDLDRRILRALEADGRITNQALSDQVGLSPSPCLRRLRRLERSGVIRGYAAIIDPEAYGWTLMAIATVSLVRQYDKEIRAFEAAARKWEEVRECYLVTGSRDYILKVMASSLQDYERFIKEKIAKLECVASIESSFVMSTIKDPRYAPSPARRSSR